MEATAKDWLDSLSAGTCELNALLKGVTELLRRSPEEGWELLSIVDQYYRRGKISPTAFATLKAHLQGLLMGKNRAEVSVPMPRSRTAAGAAAAAANATANATANAVSAETHRPASTVIRSMAAIPLLSDVSAAEAPDVAASDIATPGVAQSGTTAAAAVSAGSVLRNRYRVQGILGHGGTGTVFEAVDLYRLEAENGHEKVAIKILHPNVIRRPPLFAELRREFQRLQLLSHPSIVRVHEFDRDGETAFFTMEHLSGVLLSRVIAVRESAPLSRDHALSILRDIAGAVGYAHSRGVVHGDVSPGNIFVCNDGELRVLDFGSNGVATPGFASCQVLEGEAPDARDDIYGLACIAYVLLAGTHPFQEQTALNARALKLRPKRPGGLGASQWRALRAGLNFDRSNRPADVATWASLLNPRPPPQRLPTLPAVMSAADSRRVSYHWPALAALVMVLLGGGWWAATHVDSIRSAVTPEQTPAQPVPAATQTASTPTPPPTPVPRARVADDRTHDAPTPPLRVASSAPTTVAPPATASAQPPATASAQPPAPLPAPPPAVPPRAPPVVAGTASAPTNPGFRARLELSADNVEASPADGLVRIMVRRTRSLRGAVSFSWWTESGTAKPGRDFSPVASHVEQIEDGASAVNLLIPIIADPQRRQARSFYVVIDEADPNAAVGPRTLAMVTIPEPD